jgi:hypothetical protein
MEPDGSSDDRMMLAAAQKARAAKKEGVCGEKAETSSSPASVEFRPETGRLSQVSAKARQCITQMNWDFIYPI